LTHVKNLIEASEFLKPAAIQETRVRIRFAISGLTGFARPFERLFDNARQAHAITGIDAHQGMRGQPNICAADCRRMQSVTCA
jgi:hypothetical protein